MSLSILDEIYSCFSGIPAAMSSYYNDDNILYNVAAGGKVCFVEKLMLGRIMYFVSIEMHVHFEKYDKSLVHLDSIQLIFGPMMYMYVFRVTLQSCTCMRVHIHVHDVLDFQPWLDQVFGS